MFVNFSNHPSEKWSEKQLNAALEYGEVVDIRFPTIPPDADSEWIKEVATKKVDEIIALNPDMVMCQGEFALNFAVTAALLQHHINVVCATTERHVREVMDEKGNLIKESVFKFVQFRAYQLI